MYCSNCGKQLEDGVRFCKYCGVPTSHPETAAPEPTDIPCIKLENCIVPEKPLYGETISKNKGRKGIILATALMAVVVIISAFKFMSKKNTVSDSIAQPELPDILYVTDNDHNGFLINGQELLPMPEEIRYLQIAEDGTVAVQTNDSGEVLIYRGGVQIGEIPGQVDYFYLCGDGKKLAYGTSNTDTYLWDVSTGNGTLVSDEYASRGITYDGKWLDMGSRICKNGNAFADSGLGYIEYISPNGKYIYGGRMYRTTSEDDETTYHPSFTARIYGNNKTIFSDDSDPEGYYPYAITCSQDYKEILFRVHDDIYYFSADDMDKAQYVGNVGGGVLLPINMVQSKTSVLSYEDTVLEWCNNGYYYGGYSVRDRQYVTQKTIQNNVFCWLEAHGDIFSVSLVRFADNQLVRLIPNITGNICLSADETKLWCVSDGRLVFCDLSADLPRPVYCNADCVRAYTYDGYYADIDISGTQEAVSVPIAATSDGEKVCFIGLDGTLWMCTPETVENPQRIADNAFWVQCSSNNEFYLMKGNYTEYFNGRFCDLYLIDADGAMVYQYGNVVGVVITKSDVYIGVERDSDSPYLYDTICDLYCKNERGYKLVYEGCSPDDVHMCWWGEQYFVR